MLQPTDMLIPQFTITNLILKYIVTIEKKALQISLNPLPYRKYKELYKETQIENIMGLGEILRMPLTYEKATQIIEGKEIPKRSNRNNIFIDFRSTNEFIREYNKADQLQPSTQLIVHLNKLVGDHSFNDWDLGKFRQFGDRVIDGYDTWLQFKDFYPQIVLKDHFEHLMEWITAPDDSTHLLIKNAVILYEFLDKAPLLTLNQVTAISLYSSILKIFDYNIQNLVPITHGLSLIIDDIPTAVKIVRQNKNVTVFIELILYALSLSIIEAHNNITNILEETSIYSRKAKEALNHRQLKAIRYIEQHGKIKRSDYANLMGISFMTAYRDLKEMEEKGFIQAHGTSKATYYTLSEDSSDTLKSKQETDRPDIPVIGEDFDDIEY